MSSRGISNLAKYATSKWKFDYFYPRKMEALIMSDLRKKLMIPEENLEDFNDFLLNPENPLITDLLQIQVCYLKLKYDYF